MTTETPDDIAEPSAGPSDAELITAVRGGDSGAYEQLYRRHLDAAKRLARTLVNNPTDVDDLVAETFAKLLSTLRDGRGPDAAFRPYLLTSLRNVFYDRTRRDKRLEVTDDLSKHDPGVPFVDSAVEGLERSLAARAFARLPERWQTVLWHTEVEGDSPAKIAPLLGLTPNGVSALAYRARERLRQAYLQEHLADAASDSCGWTIEHLGAHVRGGLSNRESSRVEIHLKECDRCRVLFVELGEVNAGLRGIIGPIFLGGSTAAYLATAGGKGALFGLGIFDVARRALRTRTGQVAAGSAGVIAVAAAAMALVLTANTTPERPIAGPRNNPPAGQQEQPPPGSQPNNPPPANQPENEPDDDQPSDQPANTPGPTQSPGSSPATSPSSSPAGSPPASASPSPSATPKSSVQAELTPAGSLVRGRPGVLVMSVTNSGRASGGGGSATGIQPLRAPSSVGGPATGPLTAVVSLPPGITLRTGDPGDGWSCTAINGGARCTHSSLPAGQTTRGYLPVSVSGSAPSCQGGSAATCPGVQISGPNIAGTSSTISAVGATDSGLAAAYAQRAPASINVGGNTLMTCSDKLLSVGWTSCANSRKGQGFTDDLNNDAHAMGPYAQSGAPMSGLPKNSAVSGATIQVPGKRVIWAGLYWSGSRGDGYQAGTAYLKVPGSSGYRTVNSTRTNTVSDVGRAGTVFQSFADVTSIVQAVGPGALANAANSQQWWVGLDQRALATGTGKIGGWSLILVTEDTGAPKNVVVFDGFMLINQNSTFTAEVYGKAGSTAQIAMIGWEGDRGITGDEIRLGNSALGATDNIAQSRADGTSPGWNTFGVDARKFTATMPTNPKDQSVTVKTAGDVWILSALAVATPDT